jgi:uncharacterized surface protein with fasciclin (FAS1) repeats
MKKILFIIVMGLFMASCQQATQTAPAESAGGAATEDMGQAGVQDDASSKDIVKVAVGSPDHTTLVAALKQAEYVNDLANAGPFTVFAPTNAAFAKLPPGTVEGLMKPDKKDALRNILEYHVAVGVYNEDMIQEGQKVNMANLKDITLTKKDGKLVVNGNINVVGSVRASNGLVYVVDGVLLPPDK